MYRILSGKIIVDIDKTYIIHPLKYEYRYLAEKLYEETLQECLDDECISKDDDKFKLVLFKRKLPFNYKDQLEKNRKDIENKKVELYEAMKEKKDAVKIKEDITELDNKVMEILSILHSMDSITAEGVAEMVKNKYVLRKSIKSKVNDSILDNIMFWLAKNSINEKEFRKIARSNQFFNMVASAKDNLFKNYPLTDEQTTLMYWYRFYKNVFEHQEKPFEWIIEDDWALDGWYIYQSRKTGKSESINYVEGKMLSDAVRNSKEVYVVGGAKMNEVVYNANDDTGKAYIRAKESLVNKGKLSESAEQRLGQGFGVTG